MKICNFGGRINEERCIAHHNGCLYIGNPMQKHFARSLQTLPAVIDTVSSFCREHGANGDAVFALSFAVEEIFTNMVKYNPSGPADVTVSMDITQENVRITLEDDQDHDFDPTRSPDPDFEDALSKRQPGGLGLYLVRTMVRGVAYERQGTRNIISLSHPLE